MKINTHTHIDGNLCGIPVEVSENFARVTMTATDQMVVDENGLVHGGFIFGLADHAAMIAVNHPNVVLGSADVRFVKPVRRQEKLTAIARVTEAGGKKKIVAVSVSRDHEEVFSGIFTCFVLEKHVLSDDKPSQKKE